VVHKLTLKTKRNDILTLPNNYQTFYHEAVKIVPESRVFADPTRILAYANDASFYRLVPKLVIKVHSSHEMAAFLEVSYRCKIPVTFRAAGTSLAGQAITDSVLLVLGGGWEQYMVSEYGESITLQPGVIGADANMYLKSFSRKIGPDPASINSAMIGGIAANNASGMCCGTEDNSYKTVEHMKIIFYDGSILDTSDAGSCQEFSEAHSSLIAEMEAIRDSIRSDSKLAELIRHKYKIKNTTGYGLNAFVDYNDPIDIIKHIMIGSEGTLGFISEITYRTVLDHRHKASALMIFPDIKTACAAVMKMDRPVVAAAELMDRIALRSAEGKAGMPDYLGTLSENAAGLLVEVQAESCSELQDKIVAVERLLDGIPQVVPCSFTEKKAEYEKFWNIRKGIFPAVGALRETGTAVIIEDVAFPKENLADATLEIKRILDKYHYYDAIIYGHALDGNLHFVFSQDFNLPAEIVRYDALMQDICEMVVKQYDGSLKAEHGTGRNMAPFVQLEWGQKAYLFMRQIKQAFDPENMLNPDVIICDNQNIHLENLRPWPASHEIIDKCTSCGFCEVICPSKNLTATPRQRIALQREMARLQSTGENPALLQRLEEDYVYFGNETCAADGLCATLCPIKINTGEHTEYLRAQAVTPTGKAVAHWIAEHFSTINDVTKIGLKGADVAHSVLGTTRMTSISQSLRKISGNRIPLWNPWMPRTNTSATYTTVNHMGDNKPKVVYFPSCICRTMGAASEDKDHRPLNQAIMSLLDKSGYAVIFPRGLEKLCCGLPFESKGFVDAADNKSHELEQALLECSNDGAYVILCDTSPCVYRMKRVMDKRLKLVEPVEFIHDYLLGALTFTKLPETIALHVTCSSVKMGLHDKFKLVAEACAAKVIIPPKIGCCGFAGDKGFSTPELNESALAGLKSALPPDCHSGYSNSRTCEIGLSNQSGISYQSIVYLVDRCTIKKE
jgi:D-lactate dehydrogenase